ncbi:MAG: DinB family protein [Chloroflexi bacterium]|nr:DinB family protein [Chloroflexota bacterium]
MNTVELLQYSLGNALGILGQVTADLTQEQADWTPPGIANPIGGLYWHTLTGIDMVVHRWGLGKDPIFQTEGWQKKVVVSSALDQRKDHPPEMRETRVDLSALHEYGKVIAEVVQSWLVSLSSEDLERQIKTPVGELSLAQMIETFVIWHINAHCGEISAIKGCQGAKGYLF